jgi:hypothetical protein
MFERDQHNIIPLLKEVYLGMHNIMDSIWHVLNGHAVSLGLASEYCYVTVKKLGAGISFSLQETFQNTNG